MCFSSPGGVLPPPVGARNTPSEVPPAVLASPPGLLPSKTTAAVRAQSQMFCFFIGLSPLCQNTAAPNQAMSTIHDFQSCVRTDLDDYQLWAIENAGQPDGRLSPLHSPRRKSSSGEAGQRLTARVVCPPQQIVHRAVQIVSDAFQLFR